MYKLKVIDIYYIYTFFSLINTYLDTKFTILLHSKKQNTFILQGTDP